MFGIEDPGIYWAFILIFCCVIFAVVFGILNWNKGKETDENALETDLKWEEKEDEIRHKVTDL